MNNSKKIVPIFFACDDKYVKFTMVTLKSIMENASPNYEYKVYILNTDITEETKMKYECVKKDGFTVEYVDVSSYYDSIESRLPVRDYYNKTTYFRFFIAEMFEEYDKTIYIDSDTIVLGDISKFFEHDITNYYGVKENNKWGYLTYSRKKKLQILLSLLILTSVIQKSRFLKKPPSQKILMILCLMILCPKIWRILF